MAPPIVTAACAAILGIAPTVAAAAPPPGAAARTAAARTAAAPPAVSAARMVTAATATPEFRPCPVAAAAQAVQVPKSTLPPPQPRPSQPPVGGNGLATSGLAVPPDAPPLPGNLAARAWLVADLGTGAVLGACGPHEQRPPASVQKLLLAATVLPKLDPGQVVQITREDVDIEPGSSAVGLVTGGRYPVQTLWLGLLLVSGNDAANVLARVGGGDAGVAGTMREMNDLAYRLGARDTHAVTPHGLDGAGQFTSAYDLALIMRACLEREDFRRYELTSSAQIPPQPPRDPRGFQIQNDNQLIYDYSGALGGKTGFTDAARHTYVGVAERGGRRLVVTILDAEAVPQRTWQQGAALLDWGFSMPRDGGVGRLVAAGEVDAAASASARAQAGGQRGATSAGTGGHLTTKPQTFGVLVAVVAVFAITGVAFTAASLQRHQSRRRRRAGGTPGGRP